jgi:hypothetical protein
VTTLLPAAWFDEIGGFDESMVSWEDVDLWWRLARRGKCFAYLREPLLNYRFYTGTRRDALAADSPEAAEARAQTFSYLREKYAQEGEPMPCQGCSQRRTVYSRPAPAYKAERQPVEVATVSDKDFILCRYMSPNIGDHLVTGPHPFTREIVGVPMIRKGGYYFINYQHRAGGGTDKFLVHREDIRAAPHIFQELVSTVVETVAPPPPPPPVSIPNAPAAEPAPAASSEEVTAPPRPEPPPDATVPDIATGLKKRAEKKPDPLFELQKLPGCTADIAKWLVEEHGVQLPGDILELGRAVLDDNPTITKRRAGMIWNGAQRATGVADDASA